MHADAKIRAVLSATPVAPYSGVATRFVFEHYRQRATSPAGASRSGGRYNPPGVAALYASLRRMIALGEFTRPYRDVQPIAVACMLSLVVRVQRLVDVTDGGLMQRLGTTIEELTQPWWPGRLVPTQALGRIAHDLGIDALLVHSAIEPLERNLVIFPGNAKKPPVFVVTHGQEVAA